MKAIFLFLTAWIGPLLVRWTISSPIPLSEQPSRHNTFAILAYDPQAKEWGVAVA